MKRALFLAFALLAACRRETPRPPAAPKIPVVNESDERGSVTNIVRGTTIVSRTGEALFETSAADVIDGDPGSYWLNPPRDLPQSIVIALPARARIDRVGLRTAAHGTTANRVKFESSRDGAAWQTLTDVTAAETAAATARSCSPAWRSRSCWRSRSPG